MAYVLLLFVRCLLLLLMFAYLCWFIVYHGDRSVVHGSSRDLDLRSYFQNDSPRSKSTCFDPSEREEHGGAIRNPLSLIVQKLFEKNNSS